MASPSLTFTGHLLSRSCCANTNSSSTSFRTVRAPCVPSQGRSGTYRPQISFFKPGHGGMRAKKQHPVGLFGRNPVHGTQSTQSQSCWEKRHFLSAFFLAMLDA
jgi:hypothetical protein